MSDFLLEWARRRSRHADSATGGMRPATAGAIASFYAFEREGPAPSECAGTACRFAGGARPRGPSPAAPVFCVGRCYEAPATLTGGSFRAPRRALVDEPLVLRNILDGRERPLPERYALALDGEAIVAAVERSGLVGRGGAAFPAGKKWRAARAARGDAVVVANGDEGDPGAYVDRLLLEEDPHEVLAGMNACARAIGASLGVVYVRREYPEAARAVQRAVDEAAAARAFTDGFSVEVHVGAGSYVAGEETALLRSIEGLRAEPRPKPPYPAERGLFGRPTVVQNVETLACVPAIVNEGRRPTTKVFSLSGALESPCAVEAELGTPLSRVLHEGGGGPQPGPGRAWKMALVGGPMGTVVPAARFDVPLSYDALPGLGHGGVVVLDESVSARDLAAHLFEFAASESCGSCTPCRVGTSLLASARDRAALLRLCDTLEMGSKCGFGQAVPRPLRELLACFGDELFEEGRP